MSIRRDNKRANPNEFFSNMINRVLNQERFSYHFISKHGRSRTPRVHRSAGRFNILAILIVYIVINARPVYQQRKYSNINKYTVKLIFFTIRQFQLLIFYRFFYRVSLPSSGRFVKPCFVRQ